MALAKTLLIIDLAVVLAATPLNIELRGVGQIIDMCCQVSGRATVSSALGRKAFPLSATQPAVATFLQGEGGGDH